MDGSITLVNYTPHRALIWIGPDGEISLPQRGLARCPEAREVLGFWDAAGRIPRVSLTYERCPDLPPSRTGTILIVSQLVATQHPERADLAFPADLVRNEVGDIVAFRTLASPAERR